MVLASLFCCLLFPGAVISVSLLTECTLPADDKSRPCKEMLEFPSQEVYEPHYLYRNILFVSPRTVNFVNYPNKPGKAHC